ncbi:acyl-CoA dehydrogenase family protein [Micromonospora sp. NBC_01813]|uniref:acyl-CoA dehydrogenase family protein n=1 Tax=Micromonospora sp. NBC_01813 TaxID=2975988 RepID=UPI002DDC533F|nr:acyl-CoA dehydrogenase family protein [Micromonospora sp. NBC_01813]WSA10436.1 acyl-CoA/acyl-ACP dehydrogenase [Micromonospora sp. NBC_01813]
MAADEPTDESVLRQVTAEVLAGVPADALAATAGELGWPSVGIAESSGGSGGTLRDAAAIVRAAAAYAPELPLVEQLQANWLLAQAGWLDPRAVGPPPAVVLPEPDAPITLTTGLDGVAGAVAGAATASALLVAAIAADDGRPVLALVDQRAGGVRVEPGENLAGEPRDRVTLRGCAALRVARPAPEVTRIRVRESVLRTAALLGAIERACQLTVDHVRVRAQFGKPLLAQQAVAHAVATMAGEREQSRAAFGVALDAWDTDAEGGGADPAHRVAAARIVLSRAATTVARLAHQLHGAVGITREHPLHRGTVRLLAWRDEPDSARTAAHILGEVVTGDGDLWEWTVTGRTQELTRADRFAAYRRPSRGAAADPRRS